MTDSIQIILKPTLDAVNDIFCMENCCVDGLTGIPVDNKLVFRPAHIDLQFQANCRDVYKAVISENLPQLTLHTSSAAYTIPQYNARIEGTIHMDAQEPQPFDLRFSKLTQTTLTKDQNHFWRFIYPVDSNEWFLKIDALPYRDEFGGGHFHNLIFCDLDGHRMNLFACNANGNRWMLIESTESISYDEMDHRVLSLTIALGFVLGKRYGDYCFHVASDEPTFSQIAGVEALSLQEAKHCPYRVLHHNNTIVEQWLAQYPYQQYALDVLKSQQTDNVRWYYNDDAIVTMDAFSKISQLCYKSNDMMLATSMLIDGTMMNIEYQKPFFHVVLETITTVLLKDEDDLPPTVPQERFNNEVVPVLIEALNSIEWLTEEAKHILGNHVKHNINTAPNAKKLEFCFLKHGYTLTKADSTAIDKRNSTFHGHLSSEKRPLREQQNDMFAMSLRLHKLCSVLLLKTAGFTGKVLNNEVLFGMKDACQRQEPLFI